MPIFSRNRFTQRGEIEFERKKEYFKFGLLCFLVLAALIIGISGCAARHCGEGDEAQEVVSETDESLARSEHIAFLRSIDRYPRLINSENLLEADYVPPQLTRLNGIPAGNDIQLTFEAATAFNELYEGIMADGLSIMALSGYRTYDEQVSVFSWNLQLRVEQGMTVEQAQTETAKYVAVPGSSEHQYGRSIDVTVDGTTDHSFNTTEQGRWLMANAYKYGFIIRYPKDKEYITHIAYEPWHLRYVGTEHAAFMNENNLCLEEYITMIKKYNKGVLPED